MNAQWLRRIQLFDINCRQAVPHRQMNGFARLLIQFLKIRQAQTPYVELAESCLANRETCNPQVVNPVAAAVQKAGAFQVHQKTVDRAHRQPRKYCNLLRSESACRFTEELKQAQPPLQRRDVVTSFRSIRHTHPKTCRYKLTVRII